MLTVTWTNWDGLSLAASLAFWTLSYGFLVPGPFQRLVDAWVPLPVKPMDESSSNARKDSAYAADTSPNAAKLSLDSSKIHSVSDSTLSTRHRLRDSGTNETSQFTTTSAPITRSENDDYQVQLRLQLKNRIKASVSMWKLFSFSLTSGLAAVVLARTSWAWDPSQYFVDPHLHPSLGMRALYFMGFGSYLHASCVMFWMPKQKDFSQMIVHHMSTLFLIGLSYLYGFTRVGSVILFLHDVSDPFMEAAKVCLYSGKKSWADGLFITFAAVFIYTRNYLFPFQVILRIPPDVYDATGAVIPVFGQFVRPYCVAALWILEVLHVYWASLIIKMIGLAIINNGVEGDVRDEDDD